MHPVLHSVHVTLRSGLLGPVELSRNAGFLRLSSALNKG